MIFSSYSYLAFLLLLFVVHWSLPHSWRNALLVVASYAFYASWKWEYSALLLGVTVFNWAWARWVLAPSPGLSRLWFGVAVNLAPLVYFKYAGFLLENASWIAGCFGARGHWVAGGVILPLGISFFTFQAIAYLVDVAAGEAPLKSLRTYALFKAFWPQLIAGPILRLSEVRPQLEGARFLDYDSYSRGCRRILAGLFKKVVLADSLAPIVDSVFLTGANVGAVDVAAGTLGFGLQVYFDFSAYTDIAIGSALLFGFRFPENFDWPYASASPAEFWNRWHMSLSRWIRDYVFAPISFATRRRPAMAPVWILVAMALCGLWHGAAWTFVAWGVWHGLLLVLNQTLLKRILPPADVEHTGGRLRLLPFTILTFLAVHAGWLLFRATSLSQAGSMLRRLVTLGGGLRPSVVRENDLLVVASIFLGLALAHALRPVAAKLQGAESRWNLPLRIARPVVYAGIIVCVIVFAREAKSFVYFQF